MPAKKKGPKADARGLGELRARLDDRTALSEANQRLDGLRHLGPLPCGAQDGRACGPHATGEDAEG